MKFFPLFSLQMLHSYYRDGKCQDFTIAPTPEMQRLIKNHRCILKTTPNGLRVLIGCATQQEPLIPLHKGAVFSLHLRLQNPQFALFTDLSAFATNPAPLFTNIDTDARDSSRLALTARTTKLPPDVFAAVEINVTDSLLDLASGPEEFSIVFSPKQARWVYYCITDLNDAETQLRVVDGDASPVVFGDTNRLYLNQHPDPTDAVSVTLSVQYPEKQRFRFVSDNPIPCQQTARKRLQLQLGAHRLVDALPNPSWQHAATLSGLGGQMSQPQEIFFHVFKYIPHTFVSTGS